CHPALVSSEVIGDVRDEGSRVIGEHAQHPRAEREQHDSGGDQLWHEGEGRFLDLRNALYDADDQAHERRRPDHWGSQKRRGPERFRRESQRQVRPQPTHHKDSLKVPGKSSTRRPTGRREASVTRLWRRASRHFESIAVLNREKRESHRGLPCVEPIWIDGLLRLSYFDFCRNFILFVLVSGCLPDPRLISS